MARTEEDQLRLDKLRLEIRELRSPWNRVGKWLPLLLALFTIGYSLYTYDARKTLNEAAASRAEQAEAEAEAKLGQAQREEASVQHNLEALKEQAAALQEQIDALRRTPAAAPQQEQLAKVEKVAQAILLVPTQRLFIQVFSTDQLPEARRVNALVQANHLARTNDIENMANKNAKAPATAEIRYFSPDDADLAQRIATLASTGTTTYTARAVSNPNAGKGTLELWYPR